VSLRSSCRSPTPCCSPGRICVGPQRPYLRPSCGIGRAGPHQSVSICGTSAGAWTGFTYVRGRSLDAGQLAAVREEANPGTPPATAKELLAFVDAALDEALRSLRDVSEEELLTARAVGRARLPSNVLGLAFHAAEHTQRHTGQVITTSKIIRGLGPQLIHRTQ